MTGREVLEPHRIGIGLKNTGNIEIEEIDVNLIFMHKTAFTYLKMPDDRILSYKMQRSFRANIHWTAIGPNESTWYLVMPLWRWFPEVSTSADGLYEIWWSVGNSTSDRLTLRKIGSDIEMESSEQGVPDYRRQSAPQSEP